MAALLPGGLHSVAPSRGRLPVRTARFVAVTQEGRETSCSRPAFARLQARRSRYVLSAASSIRDRSHEPNLCHPHRPGLPQFRGCLRSGPPARPASRTVPAGYDHSTTEQHHRWRRRLCDCARTDGRRHDQQQFGGRRKRESARAGHPTGGRRRWQRRQFPVSRASVAGSDESRRADSISPRRAVPRIGEALPPILARAAAHFIVRRRCRPWLCLPGLRSARGGAIHVAVRFEKARAADSRIVPSPS